MSELEIRPLHPDETGRFAELSYYAFSGRSPDDRVADFGRRAVPERQALVAVEAGEIVSQVLIYDFGVWIDGVRYRSGGLANVATVPEKARRGHANRLLRAAIAWMRDELDMSLATLYATVYPLYNGLGWTLADDNVRFSAPPSAFRPAATAPTDSGGSVVRRLASLEDVDLLEPLYRRFAQPRTGYLDRPRWYWEDSVLRHQNGTQPRWLALWYGSDGQLGGYVLYTLTGPPLSPQPESQLNVYELVAIRPEGYQALLEFLSSHHLWSKLVIRGGRDVAWRSLVANPHLLEAQVPLKSHFLLRIVDVQRAIAHRAVRTAVAVPDVALAVRDESAPWNDGVWLIGQRDDRWICEAAPARSPDAAVDVTTLAAVFSGSLGARQAVDSGLLRATAESWRTLEALFSLPYPPYSGDFF